MSKKYNVAVVGATGNVGRELIQILEDRDFPINKLYLGQELFLYSIQSIFEFFIVIFSNVKYVFSFNKIHLFTDSNNVSFIYKLE